jgi:DNA replication protein DnaC
MDDVIEKDDENMKIFGQEFINGIEKIIKQEIDLTKISLNKYEEILLHAKHCKNLTDKMLHNNDLYFNVEKYILDTNNRSPFILTGQSGSGKSSLMGYILKKVLNQIDSNN